MSVDSSLEATHVAIRKLFESYMEAYDRLDPVAAANHHGTPSFIVHRGEIVQINTDTAVNYFKDVFAANAVEKHYWEIVDLSIDLLARNGAVVKVHWHAKRPDGSLLWDSRPTYMVANDENGWLIWGDIARTLD